MVIEMPSNLSQKGKALTLLFSDAVDTPECGSN